MALTAVYCYLRSTADSGKETFLPMKRIFKIVITGGPCAGKSTAMSWIQNAFTQRGYTVLFVPETATEFITGGVAPWTCGTNLDYQKCQMKLQIEKERLFLQAAQTMPGDKILIVCDRGALDNCAYMTQEEFAQVLAHVGANELELRNSYDAVFHLVTAAKGAEQFYTMANNAARYETPEQAVAMDDKLLAAWTGHPHLRVIDNAYDFEDKMKALLTEIGSVLGEKGPVETRRRYLIEYPDIAWLEANPTCRRVEIIQTYLVSEAGEEIRLRQSGSKGHYVYDKTISRKTPGRQTIKVERRLTSNEYLSLLMEADTSRRQIRKTRFCLTYKNQSFEIDVYPFWEKLAIAEIELSDGNAEVSFPAEIKIIRDVTGDRDYETGSLSRL